MPISFSLSNLPYILLTTCQPKSIFEKVIKELSCNHLCIEQIDQHEEVKLPLQLETTSAYICNLKTKYYTSRFLIYTTSLNDCSKTQTTTSYPDNLQGWIHIADQSEEPNQNLLTLHDFLSEAEIKALLLPNQCNESKKHLETWASEQLIETIYVEYPKDFFRNCSEDISDKTSNSILNNFKDSPSQAWLENGEDSRCPKEEKSSGNTRQELEQNQSQELESLEVKGTLLGSERQGFDRVVEVLECHIWPGHVLVSNLEVNKSDIETETKGDIQFKDINIKKNLPQNGSESKENKSEDLNNENDIDESEFEKFEHLIEHFKQVRVNSKNLNDEERRKAATDAIMLLLPFLDDQE